MKPETFTIMEENCLITEITKKAEIYFGLFWKEKMDGQKTKWMRSGSLHAAAELWGRNRIS